MHRAAHRKRPGRGPRAAAPAPSSTAARASRCIRPGRVAVRRQAAAVLAFKCSPIPNLSSRCRGMSNAHATALRPERLREVASDHSRNRAHIVSPRFAAAGRGSFRASESCIASDVLLSGSVGKLVNKSVRLRFLPSRDSCPSAKSFLRKAFTLHSSVFLEETMHGDESRTAPER
jgi:hypothetical protein